MEATSARYAARDRFAYPTEPAATPLQRYIQNACSPENYEPNLALCLEIADLINAKKGGAPREAAIAIVGFVNHRNPNVSMLALSLLDICVKNCGYPFHLQISTKEFLNELVRRFPERPPIRTTRVQNKILELIEEWRRTICETSKYKEDLGFIRDMHRLLSYKGYVFPEIRREDAAVLNPSDNLKSADEMEAEERAAQSAKLQELVRRGTPRDLQEANKLMKIMAGYDTRHKTDYRAKAAEEVSKVQQKARLLEEMLQGYSAGDEVQEGDVFEELANALASAHPKIQKMCEEESDDTEAVAKLLEINDSIHRTIQRYRLVKNGDIEGANAIPKGTLGVSGAGVKKGPDNELSLIDFGGPDEAGAESSQQPAATASADLMGGEAEQPAAAAAPQPKGNALEDDLLGLSMGGGDFGSGRGISLGAPTNGASSADIMSQFNQPAQQQTASNSIFSSPQALPHPQQQQQPAAQPQAPKANYDPFSSLSASNSRPSSMSSTPIPSAAQQQQAAAAKKPADPFAALASTPRSGSPFQFQQSTSAAKSPAPPAAAQASQPSGGGMDLLGMGDSTAPAQPQQQQQQAAGGDDEWTFSSALPDQPHEIAVTNSSIKTVFGVKRDNDTEIQLQSKISNNTPQPITDLTFQLAVTKGYTLALQPQSSRSLGPNQQNGITQSIRLQGCQRGQGTAVKMRWRASYTLNGQQQNEQGEIAGLGVS
ncbi:ADP-ribosylation factor-binding protein-like protein GGA1 [Hortaea werneckii]|nr:ADP-ribosylation factor-binding protein-like protein GGA1 [Hortaea werneckii]